MLLLANLNARNEFPNIIALKDTHVQLFCDSFTRLQLTYVRVESTWRDKKNRKKQQARAKINYVQSNTICNF